MDGETVLSGRLTAVGIPVPDSDLTFTPYPHQTIMAWNDETKEWSIAVDFRAGDSVEARRTEERDGTTYLIGAIATAPTVAKSRSKRKQLGRKPKRR